MTTKALKTSFLLGLTALIAFTSCSEEQQFTNQEKDAKRVDVSPLTPEMAKVRDLLVLLIEDLLIGLQKRLKLHGVGLVIWGLII